MYLPTYNLHSYLDGTSEANCLVNNHAARTALATITEIRRTHKNDKNRRKISLLQCKVFLYKNTCDCVLVWL